VKILIEVKKAKKSKKVRRSERLRVLIVKSKWMIWQRVKLLLLLTDTQDKMKNFLQKGNKKYKQSNQLLL
jgi:hypothetical protein